jgi:quercetin dioxygenase-like cupin family protein
MEGASGVTMRMLIGPDDKAPNFHMRQFTVAAGGNTPYHAHDFEHEVLILAGAGTLKTEQGDKPLTRNDVVFIAPNEKHQFRNTGDQPLEFICLIPAPRDCAS